MKSIIIASIVVLLFAPVALANWVVDEGFEGGVMPAGWTVISGADGYDWFVFSHANAHTGSYMATVCAYESSVGGDDWLVTPQVLVSGGDMFEFFARAWYGTEDFEVRLSTSGNAAGDFDYVLGSVTGLGDAYVRYEYDLTPYAGQNCYLAIRWIMDFYALCVDDVRVGQEASPVEGATWAAIKAMYQ
jgi:hypothetical protein